MVSAGTLRQLNQVMKIVDLFTTGIRMMFGLYKCRTLDIRHGNVELEDLET